MQKRKLTEANIQWAIKMRSEGTSINAICKTLGVAADTVRCAIDPEYAEIIRKRRHATRVKNRQIMREHPTPEIDRHPSTSEWFARLAEIPPDTRDLTGQLLGDPLPARSALWKRQCAQSS